MTTFLKRFGNIIGKVTQIVMGFGPLVSAAVPGSAGIVQTVSMDLAQVANIILQVEAIGQVAGMAGADKLKVATPLVAQVILQSALLANHKIADAGKFQLGAQKVADGIADVLNSLEAKVDTVDKA